MFLKKIYFPHEIWIPCGSLKVIWPRDYWSACLPLSILFHGDWGRTRILNIYLTTDKLTNPLLSRVANGLFGVSLFRIVFAEKQCTFFRYFRGPLVSVCHWHLPILPRVNSSWFIFVCRKPLSSCYEVCERCGCVASISNATKGWNNQQIS